MKFAGMITPLHTPFDDNGDLALEKFNDYLKVWDSWGLDGNNNIT
jgi:dihydrodipicolinate synthase/N-acetylneuraminate lyase